MSTVPLHVTYLSRVRLNPYVKLLASGVQDADSNIHTAQSYTLPWRRLLPKCRFDILHLHWVELQYNYGNVPAGQAKRSLQNLLLKLHYLQKRGIRLVYTVHNLSQHEGLHPHLNEKANRWLFDHADAIHVHNHTSAEAVAETYNRRQNVFTIPHGNYIGVYPNRVNRDEARTRLGIPPEPFVYLFIGQVRPYKGLDNLIQAFINFDDSGTMLIIAGQANDTGYAQNIRSQAESRANIKLFPDYIPDEDLQYFFNTADICVLPYRNATTSGAALLDFSFAKPIIAPAIGPFPDLVGPDRGVLFHTNNDLVDTLRQARSLDTIQASSAALTFAESRSWSTIGAQHAAMYRTITNPGN